MSDKKKILFLEQYANISGGQRVLLEIISGLDKKLYEIFAVVPEAGELSKELETLDVKYEILAGGYYSIGRKTLLDMLRYGFKAPFLISGLLNIIKKQEIDLIYANGARTFPWATIACSLARIPLIWHVHSVFADGITGRLCLLFGRFSIVKKIIVVSEAVKKPLNKLTFKIEKIYNGVDPRIYYPHDKVKLNKTELGVSPADLLVGVVGLLLDWKNQEDLIRAARLIKDEKFEGIKFLIIGDCLPNDNQSLLYKKKLEDLIEELDISDTVIFTGYRKDIPFLMRMLDILVICSKDPDPCPLVMLEAMSSGLVVIATNFGGPAEIIKESHDGLFYEAGDCRALAEKIVCLASDRTKIEQLAQNARLKIKEYFNISDYTGKINKLIELYLK
ncbi:MAG: glycosyltransferase family 4 protein [Candidatus Omnitrophota bacterium]